MCFFAEQVCRFWDERNAMWSTAGCTVASVTASYTVCACTHLTDFNVALLQRAFVQPPNKISTDDVTAAFSWSNVMQHPVPVVTVSVLVFLWLFTTSYCFYIERGCCGCGNKRRDLDSPSKLKDSLAPMRGFEHDGHDTAQSTDSDSAGTSLCNRHAFDYRLSTQNSAIFYMESMNAMDEVLTPEQHESRCSWCLDYRWVHAIKRNLVMNFLVSHPFLSVYWHHERDPFTTAQRIAVAFAILLSYCAANAAFFGRAVDSISSLGIGMYASLAVVPVAVVFPIAFQAAAYYTDCEENEAAFLATFHIVLKAGTTGAPRRGIRVLAVTWLVLAVWSIGMLFIVFVYASNFDRGSNSSSSKWLASCFTSFAQGMFLNSPLLFFIKTLYFGLKGAYLLKEYQATYSERVQESAVLVQLEEAKFQEQTHDMAVIDDYLSWLLKKLIWVPKDDVFQCQNAQNYALFQDGRIYKEIAKEIAMNLVRNLALSDYGSSTAATGLTHITRDTPSLGNRIEFKSASTVNIAQLRILARSVVVTDPVCHSASVFMCVNACMLPCGVREVQPIWQCLCCCRAICVCVWFVLMWSVNVSSFEPHRPLERLHCRRPRRHAGKHFAVIRRIRPVCRHRTWNRLSRGGPRRVRWSRFS
jgi:hypothetical protein